MLPVLVTEAGRVEEAGSARARYVCVCVCVQLRAKQYKDAQTTDEMAKRANEQMPRAPKKVVVGVRAADTRQPAWRFATSNAIVPLEASTYSVRTAKQSDRHVWLFVCARTLACVCVSV